jgi:alpha-L-rhamnosidase
VANPETHPGLWKKLVLEFGPERIDQGLYPEVFPANAFVGNYIRLELLSRYHESARILKESIGFFDYMAKRTGTLWENISTSASCNHGFASHVVHIFYRDVLGIFAVDRFQKKVTIRFTNAGITACSGEMPVGKEIIKLSWKKVANRLEYKILVPDKYIVEIINKSGLEVVRI